MSRRSSWARPTMIVHQSTNLFHSPTARPLQNNVPDFGGIKQHGTEFGDVIMLKSGAILNLTDGTVDCHSSAA